jgi:hypothetical protein
MEHVGAYIDLDIGHMDRVVERIGRMEALVGMVMSPGERSLLNTLGSVHYWLGWRKEGIRSVIG